MLTVGGRTMFLMAMVLILSDKVRASKRNPVIEWPAHDTKWGQQQYNCSVSDETKWIRPTNVFYRNYRHSSRCPLPDGLGEYHQKLPSTVGATSSLFDFFVVYFVNCKLNKRYGEWVTEMLIPERKLPLAATLFIVASSNDCAKETILHKAVHVVSSARTGSKTILECHDDDDVETYEYHGIHKVWQIGQVFPQENAIIGYFHSKGITHASSVKEVKEEKNPWFVTMSRYEKLAEAFYLFPWINKASTRCGRCGIGWYNFWYARGSYLNTVEEPILNPRRHYYEDWLGRKNSLLKYGHHKVKNYTGRTAVWASGESAWCQTFHSSDCYALEGPANMGYLYWPELPEDSFLPEQP